MKTMLFALCCLLLTSCVIPSSHPGHATPPWRPRLGITDGAVLNAWGPPLQRSVYQDHGSRYETYFYQRSNTVVMPTFGGATI